MSNEWLKFAIQQKSKKNVDFIYLQQTKNLDQFGIGIKNETPPWDSPPVFKMLKILGSKTCFTLMLHIAAQRSSQDSDSATRNSHCKGGP